MPHKPWEYEQLNSSVLVSNHKYVPGRLRLYFAMGMYVTTGSKINKPLKFLADVAGITYRNAQTYLGDLVEEGWVIRKGKPMHYTYELNEHILWHGSLEGRNKRKAKRQRDHIEHVLENGHKLKSVK